jgi:ketosteroid isomerase-like protein
MTSDDLHRAVDRLAEASEAFLNGDHTAIADHLSTTPDVTLFGGFGATATGRDAVIERLAWASARFRSGTLTYEPIASGSSGRLGYAIGIERGTATIAGTDEPRPIVLRVTHLFRLEDDRWRVIHRHADAAHEVMPATGLVAPGPATSS